ncbi:MAG: CRR6 family NdhI maturation factor [Aphanocapsa lilacina HA4352-LM1]|jgi:hypothetical protein|nr:CRR6 family NdhI maturation factor [Aphanocapsa lilacina HA4352-LM1]
MSTILRIEQSAIDRLDLGAVGTHIEQLAGDPLANARQICFEIDYPLAEADPRELPEVQEVRLFFIRLDARYPWLPYLLDWRSGELTRFAAMLVPHQFSAKDGITFAPEAMEIFVMHKIFVMADWLSSTGIANRSELRYLAQALGYDIDAEFFELLTL